MPSTNKTAVLGLSQYVADDHPTWLNDYNSDMQKIDLFAKNNDSGVDTLKGDLEVLEARVDADEANISSNTNNITTLTGNVTKNTTDISTANANIATNTQNIASQQTTLQQHTDSLASLTTQVTQNTSDINDLKNQEISVGSWTEVPLTIDPNSILQQYSGHPLKAYINNTLGLASLEGTLVLKPGQTIPSTVISVSIGTSALTLGNINTYVAMTVGGVTSDSIFSIVVRDTGLVFRPNLFFKDGYTYSEIKFSGVYKTGYSTTSRGSLENEFSAIE